MVLRPQNNFSFTNWKSPKSGLLCITFRQTNKRNILPYEPVSVVLKRVHCRDSMFPKSLRKYDLKSLKNWINTGQASVFQRKTMRDYHLSWNKKLLREANIQYYSLSWIHLFFCYKIILKTYKNTYSPSPEVFRPATCPELVGSFWPETDVEICTNMLKVKYIIVWWLIYEAKLQCGHLYWEWKNGSGYSVCEYFHHQNFISNEKPRSFYGKQMN